MLIRCFMFMLCFISISSAKCQPAKTGRSDSNKSSQAGRFTEPVFNYHITPPANWTMYDTVLNGLRIRIVKAPKSTGTDNPVVNILISNMEGKSIEDFTSSNIQYLKKNMSGVTILKRGNVDTVYNGKWFTYTKLQNGSLREMINYIIPVNGLAYMITCGSAGGTLKKYRQAFDRMARSFTPGKS